MKKLFSVKTITAFILVLTMAMLLPVQTAASATVGKYVSELYVAYGKDADAAKKTLSDKGFTPVDGNLNKNGDTYVMMGYKTTDEIRDSVTDIAVMNMDGNFNTTEYKEVLRQRKTDVAELLTEFMATIREYRANLKAGKAKATAVHDLLNKFTDDDSGKPLGDLFNSETLQDKVGITKSITDKNSGKLPDLLMILMQGNAAYIRVVESLLAVAADTNDNTWIDRFAEKDYDDMLDELEDSRPDLNTPSKRTQFLDTEYGSLATDLSKAVSDLRFEFLDYEALGLSVTEAKEKDIEAKFGNADTADQEEKADIVADELKWAQTGVLYEALKNYEGGKHAKGELLDFFMEDVDEDDVERYYPMAAAFTEGQRGGMNFVSLREQLRYAFLDYESWKKDVEKKVDFSGMASSIYTGINREMFKTDGSIAYTGAATRANNTSPEGDDDKMTDGEMILLMLGATLFAGVAYGAIKLIANTASDKVAEYVIPRLPKNVDPSLVLESQRVDDKFMVDIDSISDEYDLVSGIGKLFKVLTIFFAVATAGYTIYTLVKTDEVKLKPIPKYFVDNYTSEDGESYQLNYQAVECNRADYNQNKKQTGDSADLNADEGKQWLAIYVSKNSMAGKPLTPDFKIAETASAPGGMDGNIHTLGEKGAENLTNADYMNYSKLYSGYKSVKDKVFGESKAYVFFKLSDISKTYDESAGNMTASTINTGMFAMIGFGGLVLGGALGAIIAVLINKKKKETA